MPQNLERSFDVKSMLAKFADKNLTVDVRGYVWARFGGKNVLVGSLETEPMGTMMKTNLLTLNTNNVRQLYSGSNDAQQGTFAFTSMSSGNPNEPKYSMAIEQSAGMIVMLTTTVDINNVNTLSIQLGSIVSLKA